MEAKNRETSPFEAAIIAIEASLEHTFRPIIGSNLSQGLQALRHLDSLTKIQLEGFFSRVAIISLNDIDYDHLKAKIRDLLTETENCLMEQGTE